jgi:hypothetical protein
MPTITPPNNICNPAEVISADNSLRIGFERAGQRHEICPRQELRKTIEVMDGIGAVRACGRISPHADHLHPKGLGQPGKAHTDST